ncbi:predicted protein [Plenodomus lingam JN3]|uniref:Predicted protein n=1 Tax=Leptosphaeria maculans (strain JN3 / isolate v23.1.3 / race Av1-4-5-6-7-8) TaxID=985895 RepID=E4ZHG0_LEPMJ|nr:predicted protein [Plenodomus lingam JN3]CBX90730.1 predicted protein [Plenodomus lingam JN3]
MTSKPTARKINPNINTSIQPSQRRLILPLPLFTAPRLQHYHVRIRNPESECLRVCMCAREFEIGTRLTYLTS